MACRTAGGRVQQPAGVVAAAPSAAPAATAEGSVSMFNCTMPACWPPPRSCRWPRGRTQAPTGVGACVRPAANGMTEVVAKQAGIVQLNIDTDPSAVAAGAADGAAASTPAGC